MGADADLAGILREVVEFLESLCDIDLPLKIENARDNLLQRSRTKLSTLSSNRSSASPEPYLDMNAGKGLLLFPNRKEIEIEEYVGVEEQPLSCSPQSHQDYYESFQDIGKTITDRNSKITEAIRTMSSPKKIGHDEDAEDKLIEIYKTFTPAMTINKAHKFGPLDHKVERKSFGFVRGNIRPCWIGLVGTHLLIYNNEKDKQQPEISSIRGYMGRPASNVIFKDQEHAKSAFEIFCPGNKTLQFIAKTPREMEEWLAAISRTSLMINDRDSVTYERSTDEKLETENLDEKAPVEERYQDVGGSLPGTKSEEPVVLRTTSPAFDTDIVNKVTCNDSEKKKDLITIASVSPPILPVRLPRRLPSLPNEEALTPSYEPLDDGYEEDDIYHRIEDIRDNGRSYENVKKKSSKRVKIIKIGKKKEEKKKKKVEESTETYDDVANKQIESKKNEAKKKLRISIVQESPPKQLEAIETYDDVQNIVQETETSIICKSRSPRRDLRESFEASCEKNSSFMTYDDVLQPSSIVSVELQSKTVTRENEEIKDTPKSPTKSPQKRSFFERVRHRKESPKKEDKKKIDVINKKIEKKDKRKVSMEQTTQIIEKSCETDLPTYDDVSGYLSSQNLTPNEIIVVTQVGDISNYNCPPPPRPIYVKPPNPVRVTSVIKSEREIIEDVYDDIANYRDNIIRIEQSTEVKEIPTNFIKTIEDISNVLEKSKINANGSDNFVGNSEKIGESRVSVIIDQQNLEREKNFTVDTEHYQIPRTEPLQVNPITITANHQDEQLYDDIAILAEFRAKQRDSGSSSSHDNRSFSSIATVEKLTISMKKPWNRFGSGKKLASRDLSVTQTTRNKSDCHLDDLNDTNVDKTDTTKPNKLQKLINKMENTLGKQNSGKSAATFSNKTHSGE